MAQDRKDYDRKDNDKVLLVNRKNHLLYMTPEEVNASSPHKRKRAPTPAEQIRIDELTDQWNTFLITNKVLQELPKNWKSIVVSETGYAAWFLVIGLDKAQRLAESFYLALQESKKQDVVRGIYSISDRGERHYVVMVPNIDMYALARLTYHYQRGYRHHSSQARTVRMMYRKPLNYFNDFDEVMKVLELGNERKEFFEEQNNLAQIYTEKKQNMDMRKAAKGNDKNNWNEKMYVRELESGNSVNQTPITIEESNEIRKLLFRHFDKHKKLYDLFDPNENNPFLFGNGLPESEDLILRQDLIDSMNNADSYFFEMTEPSFHFLDQYAVAIVKSKLPKNDYVLDAELISCHQTNQDRSLAYALTFEACINLKSLELRPVIQDLIKKGVIIIESNILYLGFVKFDMHPTSVSLLTSPIETIKAYWKSYIGKNLAGLVDLWNTISRECALVSSQEECNLKEIPRIFSSNQPMSTIWAEAAAEREKLEKAWFEKLAQGDSKKEVTKTPPGRSTAP